MARGHYIVLQRGKKICETGDLNKLFSGYKIQGKPAWRLSLPEGGSYPRRHYFRGNSTLAFGKRDSVLVWNPITGYWATHNRRWFASFMIRLWMGSNFSFKTGALPNKAKNVGIQASPIFINRRVEEYIRLHWREVKKFVKGRYGIDIDESVDKVKELADWCSSEKVKQIYAKDPAKAAPVIGIAANIHNRLIETALSIDKRAEQEEKQEDLAARYEAATITLAEKLNGKPKGDAD